jgi:hypothetical protein
MKENCQVPQMSVTQKRDWQLITNKSYTCGITIEVKQKLLTTHYILSFEVITKLVLIELSTKRKVPCGLSPTKLKKEA